MPRSSGVSRRATSERSREARLATTISLVSRPPLDSRQTTTVAANIGIERLSARSRARATLSAAPLRIRLLARLINIVAAIAGLVLAVASAVGIYRIVRRLPPPRGSSLIAHLSVRPARRPPRLSDRAWWERIDSRTRSPGVSVALRLAGFLTDMLLEGRRGLGFRALGLRLVDARTGASINRRQAIIRAGSRLAWQAVISSLIPLPKVQPLADNERLRSQLEEKTRRDYAADPATRPAGSHRHLPAAQDRISQFAFGSPWLGACHSTLCSTHRRSGHP